MAALRVGPAPKAKPRSVDARANGVPQGRPLRRSVRQSRWSRALVFKVAGIVAGQPTGQQLPQFLIPCEIDHRRQDSTCVWPVHFDIDVLQVSCGIGA